ncbi:hypothetical protein F8S13_00730 [Chloroflexia bacterium SDU3-3]|nr:hypothetical protein F8S13_00730 [Chloroflexia bacterium SDU3-3]
MSLIAGAGLSAIGDSQRAGAAATEQALAALGGVPPKLLIAFTTEQHDQAKAVRGIRAAGGGAPMIGCCSGGLITAEGHTPSGVAVLALGGELEVALSIASGLSTAPTASGEQAAEALEPLLACAEGQHNLALMFADGLTGAMAMDSALSSISAVFGPLCPILGGAAGDNLNFGHTSLFANDVIENDAVALALLRTGASLGYGVHHGWKPTGRRLVITASEGNIIHEFNGRPAFEVYRQQIAQLGHAEQLHTVSRFHPIGFPQMGGEYLVRLPFGVTDQGGIKCIGALPSHAIAHIMEGDPGSLVEAATVAAQQAMRGVEGKPVAALVFDCVTRPPLLGERSSEELARIREVVGQDVPLVGMYSFGEFASAEGAPSFHNKTIVVCVIGQ